MSQLELPASPNQAAADRRFYVFTAIASTLALGLLAYLLLVRKGDPAATVDLRFMPAVNAALNSLSATLLTLGYLAIRRGNRSLHQRLMVSAFASSGLFLVGYLAYHYVHGDTKFAGTGAVRAIYFFILITHILLSMFVVPGALLTLYFAWRKSFARHHKVAKVLLPVWLYVSVTGVVIFFMLRGSVPAVP